MNTPFQKEQDILESIKTTNRLEHSLKKLLTNKKKNNIKGQSQEICKIHEKISIQLQNLRAEKEVLANDNQLLARQLMVHKQHIRELSKEIRELKKYVNFLQGYNISLKKQMAFWVKRPRTQTIFEEKYPKYEFLNQQIDNLEKMNDIRERQPAQIQSTVIVKPAPNSISKQFYVKSSTTSKKIIKNSMILSRNQEKDCIRCNHSPMINKSNKMIKNKSCTNRPKNLCSCHKSYIETSEFLY